MVLPTVGSVGSTEADADWRCSGTADGVSDDGCETSDELLTADGSGVSLGDRCTVTGGVTAAG